MHLWTPHKFLINETTAETVLLMQCFTQDVTAETDGPVGGCSHIYHSKMMAFWVNVHAWINQVQCPSVVFLLHMYNDS